MRTSWQRETKRMTGPASDKVEIIDLLGRYAWYVNSQDSDGFASCCTEDGVWEGAGFGRIEGKEALRDMWPRRTPRNPHLPLKPRVRMFTGLALTAIVAIAGPAAAETQKQPHHEPPLHVRDMRAFEGKTLEQKVQELADREEIRDMISTYAHRVAHGVPHYDLFTADGGFTVRRMPSGETEFHTGMKEIANTRARTVERFGDSLSAQKPLPMIHNYIIRIDGDEGAGMNSNELRIPERGKSIIASGYYEDRYRRVDGRWRFVRRDTTFLHWVPIQEGWARPAEPGPAAEENPPSPAK